MNSSACSAVICQPGGHKQNHNTNTVQDELLKDQFIFGICVKEVQDHVLGEITPEDYSDKCLLEAS